MRPVVTSITTTPCDVAPPVGDVRSEPAHAPGGDLSDGAARSRTRTATVAVALVLAIAVASGASACTGAPEPAPSSPSLTSATSTDSASPQASQSPATLPKIADVIKDDGSKDPYPGYLPDATFSGDQPKVVNYSPEADAKSVLFIILCDGANPYRITALAADDTEVTFFAGNECTKSPDVVSYAWPIDPSNQKAITHIRIGTAPGDAYELAAYVLR